jgi:crotonobetainyl-CoA:carnitine CoA-transferase CaiB-like acyl-CoA transferase
VVDLTHYIAGPYCTKLLAGFGAEVIKVERPRVGDKMRGMGPFYRDEESLECSLPFLWLNTGKRSITLDLKKEKGVAVLKHLVSQADLVVENFSPGVMARLGLSYEVLREVKRGLVMASISNFGQNSVYRDYKAEEMQLYAMSGAMHLTGDPNRPPLAAGSRVCQYTAGLHAYLATLMALLRRDITGEGAFVDISIQESALENIEIALTNGLQAGNASKRAKHPFVPWDLYECQDGYSVITLMPARNAHRAKEIFKDPRLFDERFAHGRGRMEDRMEYEDLLRAELRGHRKGPIFEAGQARGLAFGSLVTLAEAAESPQHVARGFFEEIDHPAVGRQRYCGAPFRMSRTPWQTDRAPLLGEHNWAVYEGVLEYSYEEMGRLMAEEVI